MEIDSVILLSTIINSRVLISSRKPVNYMKIPFHKRNASGFVNSFRIIRLCRYCVYYFDLDFYFLLSLISISLNRFTNRGKI